MVRTHRLINIEGDQFKHFSPYYHLLTEHLALVAVVSGSCNSGYSMSDNSECFTLYGHDTQADQHKGCSI